MKDILKRIIVDFHTAKLKAIEHRKISLPTNTQSIISVVGARRSGKTYLLYDTIQTLILAGVSKENILFINFEDERLQLTQSNLDLILQAYMELFPKKNLGECYFFFDEIQNVSGWEKFIRRVFDTVSKHIFVTGSNSMLLSTEIATELRGRTLTFTVYPLSFSEFLQFTKTEPAVYGTAQSIAVKQKFDVFLKYGGFPELLYLPNEFKIMRLQDYYNSVIYKDLAERYRISDVQMLKFFLRKVLQGVGKPLSINKIYNDLKSMGYKTGNNVLYEYFEYIEAVFAVKVIPKFDFSEIKQLKSDKKAYAIDNGILSAIDYSFSENKGRLLENLIAMEFTKKNVPLMYFKDKIECDFVITNDSGYLPIQVCYAIDSEETYKREIKGLLAACKHLKVAKGMILTYETEREAVEDGINIEMLPAYKYLLS